ncbi:hypothetical protein R3P38DRAFT_2892107 [Favolaschia claudopus]|uniref:Uncharacterized protein n=1 Tax=Favolaschia claudopus TaxID=2862362 RepID=A0AAW0CWY2_9AGAR
MSSTRQGSPHLQIKAEGDGEKENRVPSIYSTQESARKRVRVDSDAGATDGKLTRKDKVPVPLNTSAGPRQLTLTHTLADFRRLQQLLEDSFVFREELNDENLRLRNKLQTTRRELRKMRAIMEMAAQNLHNQASRRVRGVDSDDELEAGV